MRWITATRLVQWADTRAAEGDLPLLIRRLIIASVKEWPDLHIPAGDSIFKPGWDGVCNSSNKAKLVPAGKSCWEWGRNGNYSTKLDEDFEKRTLATTPDKQAEQTFVFVTPRRWATSKDEITVRLKAKSHWKDIVIYDADDLELWLEHCPAVGRWLALELQVMTDGVSGAEEFWESYTGQPEYIFTSEFMIGGRTATADRILDFLGNESDALELRASSKDEGAAFVIAAMLHANQDGELLVFSNCVIVSDAACLKQLNELQENLLIIYLPENDETITMLGNISNHIISVVSSRAKVRQRDIVLQVPDAGRFSEGLIDIGVDSREAHNLTKICGRSYDVLRRMLTDQAGRVSWPASYDASELIPLFFVQKFDDSKEGDHTTITSLSGKDYAGYKAGLKKWTLITGPPVSQIANQWQAVSPYDLLYIVGKYMTEEDLRSFETVFLRVMSGHDPALDLEPHMRIAAGLLKKEDIYSKWLKEGLSQTLALMSAFGADSGINTSIELQSWINQIVRQLLDAHELRFWQSVESKVHLLAEAAPQAFLDKMENLVQQHPEIVSELFNDQEAGLWSNPYHTHILWALEILAWDAALLPRVALLLGRIVLLDKGTAYANRPANSLSNIFRWWYPQTFASFKERKDIVTTLIKRNPEVAFTLLVSLSPHMSDIAMDTHKPVWRMRERYQIKVAQDEYVQGLTFNCEKLLEIAGKDPARWVKVIGLADDHQGDLRDIIINHALTIEFDPAKSDELRETLHTLMRSHVRATKKDSDWKLSKPHQDALKKIYDKLNRTATDRYVGLFNVESIETRATGDDWEKQRKLTTDKRLEAIKVILKEDGLSSIFEMVPKVKYPFSLGLALAQAHETALDEVILKLDLDQSYQRMVIGYLSGFIEKDGITWIEHRVDYFTDILTDQQLIVFYLATETSPAIWDALQQRSPHLYNLYWQTIFTGLYHPWFSNENNDAVIRHLNKYKRFTTSLDHIYDEKRITATTILDTLNGYVTDNCETDKTLRSKDHLIRKLYKYLLAENTNPDQMHLLEWYYFRLLKKDGHEKSLITYLYANLNTHPDFFARLVQFLYIPEEGEPKEEIKGMTAENVQGRAQNADAVLTGWSILPGTDKDGQCDFVALRNYFTEAIQQSEALKRKTHGIRELGKLLGRAEVKGTPWPHLEVCEIIEEYNNEAMSEGFFNGYYNRHAGEVRIRPATSNNDTESAEVTYLIDLAKNLGPKYPVTAKIISDIAASKQHWVDFMNKRDRQDNG
jgi:hypothetical protein